MITTIQLLLTLNFKTWTGRLTSLKRGEKKLILVAVKQFVNPVLIVGKK